MFKYTVFIREEIKEKKILPIPIPVPIPITIPIPIFIPIPTQTQPKSSISKILSNEEINGNDKNDIDEEKKKKRYLTNLTKI